MPLTTYDLPTLQAQCLAYFRTQFPTADSSSASYFGQLSNVLAMILLEAQNELLQVDQDWPPSGSSYTPGRQSSKAALDQAAFLLGLPDGIGGYGRLRASISSGGFGTLFAPAGTLYPDGLLLVDGTGQVIVRLNGAETVPPLQSSIGGSFVSVTTGIVANLPAGSVLTFQAPPPGAQSTVTLIFGLGGAADVESDSALLARIFDRLQNPPTGGKSTDWKRWLAGIQAIKEIYVFPKRSGTGTVDVVITAGGSGAGRRPDPATQQAAVDAYTENRPVCSQVNVLLPFFFNLLTLRALAYPSLSKYNWDWISGAGTTGYTITAFTPGSPAVLQFNGDISVLSPTLKAAIDAGAKPRIQVKANAGPEVLKQVAVTAYQVVAGPLTNLTLDALPSGWVDPIASDSIYPGGAISVNQDNAALGPIQKSAGQRVLDYVNSLGPSRMSGYADDAYYWDDTVRVSVISQTVIDTTDLDGTRMVRSTGNAPLSDVTIQIGAGTPKADDYATLDGIPGAPPEMARCIHVIVTGP